MSCQLPVPRCYHGTHICRHPVEWAGNIRSLEAKVRGVENLEEQWLVRSTLEVEGGGKLLVQLNHSNHDFAIFQPDDPCWCLTFWIWFLPLQTLDNGMWFLPHGVVLNNKSTIRHEAYSTSVPRSHSDTKCNQQTGLDVKAHGNTINFLSSNVGRFFFPILSYSFQIKEWVEWRPWK